LNQFGYPPDKQAKAVQTVLEQAEVLAKDWVATLPPQLEMTVS
jgi:type I restriction enzyme, R subunit